MSFASMGFASMGFPSRVVKFDPVWRNTHDEKLAFTLMNGVWPEEKRSMVVNQSALCPNFQHLVDL